MRCPVEAKVAASFWPMWPLLPTPVTMTRPRAACSSRTASTNGAASPLSTQRWRLRQPLDLGLQRADRRLDRLRQRGIVGLANVVGSVSASAMLNVLSSVAGAPAGVAHCEPAAGGPSRQNRIMAATAFDFGATPHWSAIALAAGRSLESKRTRGRSRRCLNGSGVRPDSRRGKRSIRSSARRCPQPMTWQPRHRDQGPACAADRAAAARRQGEFVGRLLVEGRETLPFPGRPRTCASRLIERAGVPYHRFAERRVSGSRATGRGADLE